MTRWPVATYTMTSALGGGVQAHEQALRVGRSGLRLQRFETAHFEAWLGLVDGVDDVAMPEGLQDFDCRNNRLAWLGLQADGFLARVQQAVRRYGAHRVGVFMGTSTSGILQTEQAYRARDPQTGALPSSLHYPETHNTGSLSRFVQAALGLSGPAWSVSTACSSGAKAFGNAERLLSLGLIDAAVVGGVDSLCLTTLYGFNSLELVSPDICRPWDAGRRGLSLGEAAAFALLERDADRPVAWLRGVGESSDGHHMSSPLPDGSGAAMAMRQALERGGVDANEVGYVNLHGTATPNNDAAEDQAMQAVFPHVPCSSTKGATGHTLGAAGALEAGFAMVALQTGYLPGGSTLLQPDPALKSHYLREGRDAAPRLVASNSFGFGGTNTCLLFEAAA
ncbi:beta-ketoacyl-[acyl-carrier-protein] synthase family protein [Ideonella sp. DXS29W]|uniref:Beta-ketoacyl-[acyl-carrier-protein] synthase family protein n=1 Tax=Ideonella lacteola TaxID=2984193 RepID=A0ABU9BNI7_9BURK